ncbi:MAG: FtsW/RodA/SpoVE family cell cycle protein [Alloprevotella sp.]
MSINTKRLFQGDAVIWIVFFFLCMISLVEVFSAASSLSYGGGSYMQPLFKQAGFLALGTGVVWFFHAIPCRYFKLIPVIGYPLSVLLLLLTLMMGATLNDGARWIDIGIRFQPSEIAKGVLVVTVALVLSFGQTEKGAAPDVMKRVLWLSGIVCGLIFPENFSTAVLLFGTVFVMMFVGRVSLKQMGRLVAALVGLLLVVVLLVKVLPADVINNNKLLHRMDTWTERLTSHVGSRDSMNVKEVLQENPQSSHAKIAIASSNVFGKMPGNSEERDHLPQAFSDFIYAIIIEELGIIGAVFVVFLYVVLLFRAGRIASRCERNFPAFLTMGLAVLLVMQAMMNVLVAVGLAPVTGQPLPLISRGGTSTLINCAYFGMILSVSRYARKVEKKPKAAELPAKVEEDEHAAEFQKDDGLQ